MRFDCDAKRAAKLIAARCRSAVDLGEDQLGAQQDVAEVRTPSPPFLGVHAGLQRVAIAFWRTSLVFDP